MCAYWKSRVSKKSYGYWQFVIEWGFEMWQVWLKVKSKRRQHWQWITMDIGHCTGHDPKKWPNKLNTETQQHCSGNTKDTLVPIYNNI